MCCVFNCQCPTLQVHCRGGQISDYMPGLLVFLFIGAEWSASFTNVFSNVTTRERKNLLTCKAEVVFFFFLFLLFFYLLSICKQNAVHGDVMHLDAVTVACTAGSESLSLLHYTCQIMPGRTIRNMQVCGKL